MLRRSTWLVLEPADEVAASTGLRRASRAFDVALIVLIVLNVVAVMLESVSSIGTRYRWWFSTFEIFSVAIFTIEYGSRIWASAERQPEQPLRARLRYSVTPMALIDLLAILPFYLSFITGIDLRTLRVLRLLRVLKLSRYASSMRLLQDALRQEAHAIAAALFVLVLMLIVAASLAHFAEHEAQPEDFGSIPHTLWWAVVTMTTVGYGDAVPVTPLGKVIGGLIGILGIGMVALPAGLLASGFSEQLHRRRQTFEREARRMLADGLLSPEEGRYLDQLRERIGLSDQQAAEILRVVRDRREQLTCPHCGRRHFEPPPLNDRNGES
jgi:voltage-gated potassium channel